MLVLALVLLAAQALGLVHRSLHVGAPMPGQPHALALQAGPASAPTLFADHESGTPECRLIDSLGHHAAPAAPALLLPMVPSLFVLAWFEGECVARWVALFDARGPPQRS